MKDLDAEEIDLINAYHEHDDEDEEEDEEKDNITSSFKEFVVKKIKLSEEIITKLEFDNINYLQVNTADEGYLQSYSIGDFLESKINKYNAYPINRINVYNVNVQKFVDNLFKFNIPAKSYVHHINKTDKKIKADELVIGFVDVNRNKILLSIDYSSCTIFYSKPTVYNENESETLLILLGIIENFVEPKVKKNKIYVVYKSQHGFDKTGFAIKKININLNENYNDGFPEVAQEIIAGLNKKKKTSLVILSGCPGSGKTTFIRYMASKLKKNIIFISPDMVNYITDPSFIPFLMKNNDSILIIEDAEPALETRDTGRTGAVSNILNLTDGLLSDCLNISIVATFNTESGKIDSALLRKGRLLKNYKFEKLAANKSTLLLKKLGHNTEASGPMALSDIYYFETDNNAPENLSHKVIGGFGKR